jgi:hypothetical protein
MQVLPLIVQLAQIVVPLVVGALGMHVHHKRKQKKQAQKDAATS